MQVYTHKNKNNGNSRGKMRLGCTLYILTTKTFMDENEWEKPNINRKVKKNDGNRGEGEEKNERANKKSNFICDDNNSNESNGAC